MTSLLTMKCRIASQRHFVAPPAGSAGVWGGAAQKDDLVPNHVAAIAFSAACRQVYEGVALQHTA